MNQVFGCCNLTYAPLREKNTHSSQMVSQLLYGMGYEVLQSENKWLKIKVLFDGYEGYLHRAQHLEVPWNSLQTSKKVVADTLFTNGIVVLPGSEVACDEEAQCKSVLELWQSWLNVPYLWGGISIWGTDCSGFIQTIFKIAGTALPRDSKDQATIGQPVEWHHRQEGDLLFFGDEKITHTALLLEKDHIVHCYGRVRCDKLVAEGILTQEFGLTHSLKAIRRVA